jgi:hypothetical protein
MMEAKAVLEVANAEPAAAAKMDQLPRRFFQASAGELALTVASYPVS